MNTDPIFNIESLPFIEALKLTFQVEFLLKKPETQRDCWVIIRDYAQEILDLE